MTKCIQVVLHDADYDEIRRLAHLRQQLVARWVHQALDAARQRESDSDVCKKLEIIRVAAKHEFPSGDPGAMAAEIGSGYGIDEGS